MTAPSADAKTAAIQTAAATPATTKTVATRLTQPVANAAAPAGAAGKPGAQATPSGSILNAGSASGLRAVGGRSTCQLAVALSNGQPSQTDYVDFEMGPARRSFMDKQGQSVPGAGAGLEQTTKTSLAKLLVAGAQPVYQAMGIAEECIEFVGAFVGFDDGQGAYDGNPQNAWEKSQRLAMAVRAQREMVLTLAWTFGPNASGHHALMYNTRGQDVPFKGYVKSVTRAYAHAQRVYYRIVFCLTNRENLYDGAEAALGTPVMVPTPVSLDPDEGTPTTTAGTASGAPNPTPKPTEPAPQQPAAPSPGKPLVPAVPGDKLENYIPGGKVLLPMGPVPDPAALPFATSAVPSQVAAYYAGANTVVPDLNLFQRFAPAASPEELATMRAAMPNMQAGVPAKGQGTGGVSMRTALEVRSTLQDARVAATQAGNVAATDHFRALEERANYHIASLADGTTAPPADLNRMQVRERRLAALTHQLGGTAALTSLPVETIASAFDFPDDVVALTAASPHFEIPDLDLAAGYLVFDNELDFLYGADAAHGLTEPVFGHQAEDVAWYQVNPRGTFAFLMYQTRDAETRTLQLIRA